MYNPMIEVLLREHVRMRRVLRVIGLELDKIERCERLDFSLLREALYYMREFPGKLHHPREERLFRLLALADPGHREDLETLREQHQEIYQLEEWLCEMARDAAERGAAAYPRLLVFGRRYLLLQQEHARMEEQLAFPAAIRCLRAEDWATLSRPARGRDPERLEESRAALLTFYRRLMREAAAA